MTIDTYRLILRKKFDPISLVWVRKNLCKMFFQDLFKERVAFNEISRADLEKLNYFQEFWRFAFIYSKHKILNQIKISCIVFDDLSKQS